ncbi:MAG TPA: alpha/beta hydrolase-fold protein [Pyrinomonadaceae bacterium]|nr:alpha/beta hydrolase-fold protein [Pyrinomonadaceae bacterium]
MKINGAASAALICILLFAVFNISAQSEREKFPGVVIPGAHLRTLKSKDTGRTYDLYFQLPDLKAGKKYPVLFVLDGQWDFKLLDSVYGGLHYDKFVPEMIIVGITYSGKNPNYDQLRAMDYTPTAVKNVPGSGDAAKFLDFLKKDVFPFVEKNYQADASKRILMGSSYGGLFTLYAMFTEPELFYGYVAAAPAVSFDDNFSFKQEKKFAETNKNLPVRLSISVGGVEELTPSVKAFMDVLKSRAYSGLKLETRVIEGERHAGNKPEAYNRGLRFMFNDQ